MWAATRRALRLSGFAAFARHAWKTPAIANLHGFVNKAAAARRSWKTLSTPKKARWSKIGERLRCRRRGGSGPRKPNAWAKFVRRHYKRVAKLPFKKQLKALRKLWNTKQQQQQ